ncbi:isochorismatase family protein [Xylophilus rhododendri]|uniref:Isochorismatase family protein n=1 Tax=Xylophilus rhododendri TaxID=2697032 RepID=A0A857J0C5_9BURK|nr:cysteine hydrolase family protein [Xylophilus rhododendri]QHI96723.1 isochorismatase family protein [Xylophilus rhododendri]
MSNSLSTPAAAPRRALLVIDVQNEYVTGGLRIEYPPVHDSLERIAQAIDAANAAGIPVVLVQNDAPETSPVFARGSDGWKLHASVASRPHALVISKTLPSVFAGTALADWLSKQRIDTITVAGYMSHNCDASTIVDALHRGLKAEFLSDATGSLPYANTAGSASAEEIHRVFSVVLHSRFAAVATTQAWVDAVAAGAELPRGNIVASNAEALERLPVML